MRIRLEQAQGRVVEEGREVAGPMNGATSFCTPSQVGWTAPMSHVSSYSPALVGRR